MKTILLAGAGNMGFAMLKGWMRSLEGNYRFVVVDPVAKQSQFHFEGNDESRVLFACNLSELPPEVKPTAVVLAIKPDIVDEALKAMTPRLQADTLIVSVVAGKSINSIRQAMLDGRPVVRVMPNIGALIGQSVSAGIASNDTTTEQRKLVETLFGAIGQFVWLHSEDDLHAVTAVSGSGPAYFFAVCEAMVAAAIEVGLDEAVAKALVFGTCHAASGLLKEHPDAFFLREKVTSPNGTTAAGLTVLMQEERLQKLLANAVHAARQRSIEMM